MLQSNTVGTASAAVELAPHPLRPAPASMQVQVGVMASDAGLRLEYRLAGDLSGVIVPPPGLTRRVDGLWHGTCFEAFIAGAHWPAYREFNFSPSGAWAAYDFRAYRDGATPPPVAAPRWQRETTRDSLILGVALRAEDLPPGERLRLGLAAVVEARDGSLSYWALRHPAERPDFHHAGGFVVALPLPGHAPGAASDLGGAP